LDYEHGINGLPQNFVKAAELFRKSADQGNSSSESELGWLYMSGKGVRRDYDQALSLLQKAVAQNNFIAMNNLG
jgi:TPR repeat protein